MTRSRTGEGRPGPSPRPVDHDLSLFEQILLKTDGTVTDLVALYAGEPIRVRKLEQQVLESTPSPELGCPAPTRVMIRRILLSGARRNYVQADSEFVLDRLPAAIRDAMLATERPVGLLWKEARLETFREILGHVIGPCAAIAAHFGLDPSADFVARTYLVHHGGRPMGRITERWPVGVFRRAVSGDLG